MKILVYSAMPLENRLKGGNISSMNDVVMDELRKTTFFFIECKGNTNPL